MAIIQQSSLFSWRKIDQLGDLERLVLVIEYMPDGELMDVLRAERKHGRKDYPVEAMWNGILAGVVFQHNSIAGLIRELRRNAQLREMCGFDPLKGAEDVPSKSAFSRFLGRLILHQALVNQMFETQVDTLASLLPDLGKAVAFDGKALPSWAKKKGHVEDRRAEREADYGVKRYKGIKEDGSSWTKIKAWFGFRIHLLVDAKYELPLAYEVTKASTAEQPLARELFKTFSKKHPELVETCKYAMADKEYDGHELVAGLWDKYGIKPIIDIRNMWKDPDKTRPLYERKVINVTYDYKGQVFCHCPETDEIRHMAFGGFEPKRNTLRYHCPAKHYGFECKGAAQCPIANGIRIPLEKDRRVFTPVARSSYKWKRLYNMRTSVERVNSRLETSFGFKSHTIRGLKKMKLRCSLALCIMLAMSIGRIKQRHPELMRSLLRAA